MLRSSLVAAGAAMLCAVASAQNVDLSRAYPITTPVKDAGIYDMQSGKFYPKTQAAALGAAQQKVYTNTCNSNGSWYVGSEFCDDNFDEGRIPAAGPVGAGPNNNTNTWQIGYCSNAVIGQVDIDFEVFDTNVGGDNACLQKLAGLDIPGTGIAGFDSSAAGFPLPGGAATGTLGCWLVTFTTTTPICMQSGAGTTDKFVWRYRDNTSPTNSGFMPNGPILAGWPPASGAYTYNTPPATDPISGGPCGSGLAQADQWWINVDNTPIGGVPPAACIGSPPVGTNCYWFGGYPTTGPFAGLYFRIEADGGCTTCTGNVSDYCTAKVNSLGCTPAFGHVGTPDFNAGAGFVLSVTNLVGGATKSGLFFHGVNGRAGTGFHGGYLCMKSAPIATKRGPTHTLGGVATTCSGVLSEDFNVYIASGKNPVLTAGAVVQIEGWCRDPNIGGFGDSLSSAKEFTICP